MINDNSILTNLIKEVENLLEVTPKYPMYSLDWYNNAPSKAGVYFVWEKDVIVYIGETANIRKRMADLKRTQNHTLRRKIGSDLFSTDPDFKPANSKTKFPYSIKTKINAYCNRSFKVSYIPLIIGRKEIEEVFLNRKPKPKYNSPSKRKGS
ncbi:GIY-YIG nuclease family protein [Cytobacillus gottheilii]|uniref:GIY-YIG nuclease family protein n=1 Tax=Cytobacillus gottheilii TaxID=859144 RepID=UPI00249472AB|nr:hypothetical protein [Cytobacillus gottheilii]